MSNLGSYIAETQECLRRMSDKEFDDNEKHYVCYCDGSGWVNKFKNPRGIAASAYVILKHGDMIAEKSKAFIGSTSNRMELLAIISAVNACPKGSYVDVYSDSQYAVTTLYKADTNCYSNSDLVRSYIEHSKHCEKVHFHWVKGHNGNKWNEYVDNLAHTAFVNLAKEYGVPVRTM